MRLVHFTKEKSIKIKTYKARKDSYASKPYGLWVSDEDDYGWKKWCEASEYALDRFENAHAISLKEGANILFIKNEKELDAFNTKYKKIDLNPLLPDLGLIEWERVRAEYDGIIITPYLWERRLDFNCFWYYGFDCASGCIWDMRAIEKIETLQKTNLNI